MTPPPVRDNADLVTRMKTLSARLRALDCPLSAIPADLIAEGDLLRRYIRRLVGRETAAVDQAASSLLDALDQTVVG